MNPLKFPVVGTLLLYVFAGLLAFYMPPSPSEISNNFTFKQVNLEALAR